MRRLGLLMLLPLMACSAGQAEPRAETGEAAEARRGEVVGVALALLDSGFGDQ